MRFWGAVIVFWGRLGWRVGHGGGRCWEQLAGSEMVVKNVEKTVFFEIDVSWSGFDLESIQC